MGKNNKSKDSSNKKNSNKEKMESEEAMTNNKRPRDKSNEDSPSELFKKPNKIASSQTSGSGPSNKSMKGEGEGEKYTFTLFNSKGRDLEYKKDNSESRSKIVNDKLSNRYNAKSLPPFVAFIDGIGYSPEQPSINIGNMHPIELSDYICKNCADEDILKFKRLG